MGYNHLRLLTGICGGWLLALVSVCPARSEPPGAAYIFPAGAQRGTTIEARIGGYYFHNDAVLEMHSHGVRGEPRLEEMQTLFFHGPLIAKPASQGREDYPKDYRAKITTSANALLGSHSWSCSTVQGVTPLMKFIVGDLPEILEHEIEGPQPPVDVRLPITINGRIFPREDMDAWRFQAEKGERITCEVSAREVASPLQAVLEMFDAQGHQLIDTDSGTSHHGDPFVSFLAPESGDYHVRIRDAGFSGGQAFVYRLSVYRGGRLKAVFPLGGRTGEDVAVSVYESGSPHPNVLRRHTPEATGIHAVEVPRASGVPGCAAFDVSDVPEAVHWPSGEIAGLAEGFAPVPGVLNGCILVPGETHEWRVRLEPKTTLRAEVVASALDSRLDSILSLMDAQGHEVIKNDDAIEGRPDSVLQYSTEKGGDYVLKIRDRFSGRGGINFGYRIRLGLVPSNDFQLRLASDFFNAPRETDDPSSVDGKPAEAKPLPKPPGLKLEVLGTNAAQKEIQLEIEGLPTGVDFEPKVIPAKAKSVELRFRPKPEARLGVTPLRIYGTIRDGENSLRRTAESMNGSGREAEVRLAVVPRVPFKFVGEYWIANDQPAGTSQRRAYRLERGGYTGPLRAMLSDKQIRCLQRATGDPVEIAPDKDDFEFLARYPTEVQLGWTSRIQLMVVGTVRDDEGRDRPISYTSADPDDQMISVLSAGLLGLQTKQTSVAASAGNIEIPVRVRRHETLRNASVRLALKTPQHIKGVHAPEVRLDPSQHEAVLRAHIDPGAGPFNMPLEIVATTIPPAEEPTHTATLPIEFLSTELRVSQ